MPITLTQEQLEFLQSNLLWILVGILFLFNSFVLLFWKIIGIIYTTVFKKEKIEVKPEQKKEQIQQIKSKPKTKQWAINDEGYLELN